MGGTSLAWALVLAGLCVAAEDPSFLFWSSDFHISPIHDLKLVYSDLGMRVVDKSLSGHCHLTKTCATDLRVITKQNGINLGKCPNQLRRRFYDEYKNDVRMKEVDAFVCQHAAGLCEVFMPFGRPLVVIASTRYEIGRHDPERWRLWNENLRRIAADPRNVVAANNLYDAKYVEYFTGLSVPVIANWCGYASFAPQPRTAAHKVLVAPSGRAPPRDLLQRLKASAQRSAFDFATISEVYPGRFAYDQLARHPAIILIPYQVSVMSLFEYYRMCVPLFAPSPQLLTNWHKKFNLLKERTWFGVYNRPRRASPLPRHPMASDPLFDYDPNNDHDRAAIEKWLELADFYQWPHIQTFDSLDDVVGLIERTDLDDVSRKMAVENDRVKGAITGQWRAIFDRIFADGPKDRSPPALGYDDAMRTYYNVKVNPGCHGDADLPGQQQQQQQQQKRRKPLAHNATTMMTPPSSPSSSSLKEASESEASPLSRPRRQLLEERNGTAGLVTGGAPMMMLKRVISYGLYGSDPKYTQGALRNADLAPSVFPGWTARFYCDGSVPAVIRAGLAARGAEVVLVAADPKLRGKIAGMFWRFLVADDATVDAWIVRDTDSRLNAREKAAVDEWLASGRKLHVMRDHLNHQRPINAGMFGGRADLLGDGATAAQKQQKQQPSAMTMTAMVRQWADKQGYGGDLRFLNKAIWPRVKHDVLGHDAYYCAQFPNSRPFPTRRPDNFQHVGQVFSAKDEPRLSDINRFMLNRPAPPKCRGDHAWTFG